jgi:hypothetical protein
MIGCFTPALPSCSAPAFAGSGRAHCRGRCWWRRPRQAAHARPRATRPEAPPGERGDVTQAAHQPVADHGIADALADDEAATCRGPGPVDGIRAQKVDHQQRRARPGAPAHHRREVGGRAETLRVSQHGRRQSPAQAERLSRPLRRRAARMARPARVRMRRRNPCVLARRLLLGWNVRLLTGIFAPASAWTDSVVCCRAALTGLPPGLRAQGERPDAARPRHDTRCPRAGSKPRAGLSARVWTTG